MNELLFHLSEDSTNDVQKQQRLIKVRRFLQIFDDGRLDLVSTNFKNDLWGFNVW